MFKECNQAARFAQFGLRQSGKCRHRPLTGFYDGFNASGVEGAQMRIVHQRRRAVAAAGIFAVTARAGAVEIADGQSRVTAAERGRCRRFNLRPAMR